MVVDRQLAEDVTQAVFVALARQAGILQHRAVLTGWLHLTTRNLAAKTVRAEVRRRTREHQAATMQAPPNGTEAAWDQIAPHLDAALGQLDEPDRDVLLLRYFERQSVCEIGARLGLGEEAAQKRVSRALERLRGVFVKRGLAVPAASLGGAILLQAVQAAPAGLAATVLTGVTAMTGAGASTTFLLFKLMASTQLKVAVASVVTAGFVTTLVLQHRQTEQQLAELTRLRAELAAPEPAAAPPPSEPPPARPSDEVLQLRGEVAQLNREVTGLRAENQQNSARLRAAQGLRPAPAAIPAPLDSFPRESWAFAGYADPESTLASTLWAGLNGDLQTFLAGMTPEEQARHQRKWEDKGDESQIRDGVVAEFGRTKAVRILGMEALSDHEIILNLLVEEDGGRSETTRMVVRRTGNEWKMAGPYRPPQQPGPPPTTP